MLRRRDGAELFRDDEPEPRDDVEPELRDDEAELRFEEAELRFEEAELRAAVDRADPALREAEPEVRRVEALELRDELAPVRERLLLRRVPEERWSRGISARTTSLTSRVSSASRNFAIRSSSRRIARASCAVSLSPTSLASVSNRL